MTNNSIHYELTGLKNEFLVDGVSDAEEVAKTKRCFVCRWHY